MVSNQTSAQIKLIGEATAYDKKQALEEKRPSFRSDRTQFTVILPNLNYGVTAQDATQVTTQDTAQVQRLLDVLGDAPISKQELMVRCGIKTVATSGKSI